MERPAQWDAHSEECISHGAQSLVPLKPTLPKQVQSRAMLFSFTGAKLRCKMREASSLGQCKSTTFSCSTTGILK